MIRIVLALVMLTAACSSAQQGLTVEHAVFYQAQTATLTQGVRLFSDRTGYTASASVPERFWGMSFIQGNFDGIGFRCLSGGTLHAMVRADTTDLQDNLLDKGFVRTDDPELQLFGTAELGRVVILSGSVQAGDEITTNRYTVFLSPDPITVQLPAISTETETLYNGIELPADPRARTDMFSYGYDPLPVPYLDNPPAVIPIDVGRQLFVDDFLIEQTTLTRVHHKAQKFEGNPVMAPETDLEHHVDLPGVSPKSGGVWWDPTDQQFKMWYEAGWDGMHAYATSSDGISWERPDLGLIAGSNAILPEEPNPVSTTVFIDYDAEAGQRFKMFSSGRGGGLRTSYVRTSPDGIHWGQAVETSGVGDRSTMFYNPFRKKWVYSIRTVQRYRSDIGRARYYREHDDLLAGAKWSDIDVVFWTGADRLDPPDPNIGDDAQLYNLDAVAYESLMLGIHQIHLGPANSVCELTGIPKITELMISFSRDGFHWDRPLREAFIPASRIENDWEYGYLQPVGGICTVVGDELWFYYCGYRGNNQPGDKGYYSNASTGFAKLRRDGFTSMNASQQGTLTTRPVRFANGRRLFVNVDCPDGQLRVEVLNEAGVPFEGLTLADSVPLTTDSTLAQMRWSSGKDLSDLQGEPVRFRFHLTGGKLYAFWVSPDDSGASGGYVAGGGPGYTSNVDTVGRGAFGGPGSAVNPHEIFTPQDLEGVNDDLSAHYVLMNDLDLSGQSYTTAVIAPDTDETTTAFVGMPFTGMFDGSGFTISNLAVTGQGHHYTALFGALGDGGRVVNLGIANAVIVGGRNVGCLVGENFGTIDNCHAVGTVTSSAYHSGGLVGHNMGTISDSHTAGSMTSSSDYVGGLVGRNVGSVVGSSATMTVSSSGTLIGGLIGFSRDGNARIVDCYATGNVTGTGAGNHVGGLIGRTIDGTGIINCYALGNVQGGGTHVGGLVGQMAGDTLVNCYATGDVVGARMHTGGLIGENSGSIIHSYATGAVDGPDGFTGGLVGRNVGPITGCYALGAVSGQGVNVGGLVGFHRDAMGIIDNCFATGSVSNTADYTGGLVGRCIGGRVTNSYSTGSVAGVGGNVSGFIGGLNTATVADANFWDTQTSGWSSGIGAVGRTTAQMQDVNTFLSAGWTFYGVGGNGDAPYWVMPEDVGYPLLYAIWQGYKPAELEGDGTSTDPYRLSTAGHLEMVNNDPSAHYVLVNTIDLKGATYANAVIAPQTGDAGDFFSGTPFTGVLDGNGHAIKHLTVAGQDSSFVGLIGCMADGGEVVNLQLEAVDISGNAYVGGLAGSNAGGTMTGCTVGGTVAGRYFVGGLAGAADGQIADSSAEITISAVGSYVGGLVGSLGKDGEIVDSHAAGTVSGNDRVGGLIGHNKGQVERTHFAGDIEGNGYIGGLAGWNGGAIADAHATGAVTGQWRIGGLVGWNSGLITGSYAGAIVSADNLYSGGLVGQNHNSGTIADAYALGGVTGVDFVGGLVGENTGTIENARAFGDVNGVFLVGGLVGENIESYFGGTLTGQEAMIVGSGASGTVHGQTTRIGGLVGRSTGSVSNSYAEGDIFSVSHTGGLIGENLGSVENAYATGTISGSGGFAGGLVGRNTGGIYTSYAEGAVSGEDLYVGGLVGFNRDATAILFNCYAAGAVSSTVDEVGGLVGRSLGGAVLNCYAVGPVTGVGPRVGGLIGLSSATVRNSFWDMDTSGQISSSGGLGRTTAQMNNPATFTGSGWNYTSVWTQFSQTYPLLRWRVESILPADLNNDGAVNLYDLLLMAENWQKQGSNLVGDLNNDGIVDLSDYAIIASQWLLNW